MHNRKGTKRSVVFKIKRLPSKRPELWLYHVTDFRWKLPSLQWKQKSLRIVEYWTKCYSYPNIKPNIIWLNTHLRRRVYSWKISWKTSVLVYYLSPFLNSTRSPTSCISMLTDEKELNLNSGGSGGKQSSRVQDIFQL